MRLNDDDDGKWERIYGHAAYGQNARFAEKVLEKLQRRHFWILEKATEEDRWRWFGDKQISRYRSVGGSWRNYYDDIVREMRKR